jgi:hypothetical protein
VRMPRYMLGPAKRKKRKLNEIQDAEEPHQVAIYRVPPKVIECVYIWAANISKTGEHDMNCLLGRESARAHARYHAQSILFAGHRLII